MAKKIWRMCLELAAGSEGAAKAILEKHSAFEADGNTFKVTDIKQFKSGKWVKATYGRVKKAYENAFGPMDDE